MEKTLINLGLSENEAIIYRHLLEYGQKSPSSIAKAINLSRENTYFQLKNLAKKGLIEELQKKGKLAYSPLDPKQLFVLIERKKIEALEQEESLKKLIPSVQNLYNLSSSKPGVTFFKGISGIKEMYEDVYRDKKPAEIIVFRSIFDDSELKEFAKKDFIRLQKLGIRTRYISSEKADLRRKKGNLLIEGKIINSNLLDLPAEFAIYNNKVLISAFNNQKMGIIIENFEVAESLKMIFNYIWLNGKDQSTNSKTNRKALG